MRNILFISCLCIYLSACGSHYGAAYIVSNPPGAQVINTDDGSTLGVTPTTVWWKDSSSDRQYIAVRFRKNGYYEKVDSFWLSMRHSDVAAAMQDLTRVEVNLLKKGE